MADDTQYRIRGHVVDRRTKAGVRGLRVEAWDRDTRYHDLLGDDLTMSDGEFTIRFTGVYFGDYAPDRLPDIFFKVFLGDRLLLSTRDSSLENVRATEIEVTLEVDMPDEKPATPDRVSTTRAIMVVDFLRQSDFKGVTREAGNRARTAGRLVANVAKHFIDTVELQPLKPPAVRSNDVIGQEAFIAERNLGANGVEVNERHPYDPKDAAQQGRILRSAPTNLRRGDRVDLYLDENQQVKGYAVVRATKSTDINAQDVARLDLEVTTLRANFRDVSSVRDEVGSLRAEQEHTRAELNSEVADVRTQVSAVAGLRSELGAVRRESADKDRMIAELKTELTSLRAEHDQFKQHASPARLAAMEAELRDLARRVPPTRPIP